MSFSKPEISIPDEIEFLISNDVVSFILSLNFGLWWKTTFLWIVLRERETYRKRERWIEIYVVERDKSRNIERRIDITRERERERHIERERER